MLKELPGIKQRRKNKIYTDCVTMETKVLILPAYTLNNCSSTANVENYSLKNNPEVTKIVKATYSSVKKNAQFGVKFICTPALRVNISIRGKH